MGSGEHRRERTADVSIFDLDRTLTRWPTYSAFLFAAARRTAPLRLLLIPAVLPCWLAHRAGLIRRKTLKQAMHRLMLGRRVPRATLDRLTAAFVARVAERWLYPQAAALIDEERRAGRRLVLATAAPAYYATALGERLGFDAVVATGSSWADGRLLPTISGENCYGPDKQRMLRALLATDGASGARHIRFFSDDLSDLPTFEWCHEPVAVNPSRTLRSVATARGWTQLDWRRSARTAPARHAIAAVAAPRS